MGQSVLGQELLGVPEAARAVAGLGQQHRGGLVDLPDGLQHAFQVDGAGGGDEQHEVGRVHRRLHQIGLQGRRVDQHPFLLGGRGDGEPVDDLHPEGQWAAGR